MDEVCQSEVKRTLLQVLESPCRNARNAASQAIAKIARLDLSVNGWPELLPTIKALTEKDLVSRVMAYQVLGYCSDDIQSLSDELQRELITEETRTLFLSMMSRGLMEPDADVKLAALKAFYYGVLFADKFLQIEGDRRQLFVVIGQCLQHAREDVQLAAWEVLLQMTNEFYHLLGDYMADLRDLSIQRMQGNCLATALSAVEFWSTVCDEELIIMLSNDNNKSKTNFVKAHYEYLLPVLFEAVASETDEDADEDEWTLSRAAATCIGIFAQVLRQDILPASLHFVEANFNAAEWNRRDAAVLVYGSILEGPPTDAFRPLLKNSFPALVSKLSDPSIAVRDSAAWSIGRVAKFHLEAILDTLDTPERPGLISELLSKLSSEPRVAANVCFALFEICSELEEYSSQYSIEPFFAVLAEALVNVAKRPDANENQLRQAACHALYALVIQGGGQTNAMKILLETILEWLEGTIQQPLTDEITSIQGPMCGCVSTLR